MTKKLIFLLSLLLILPIVSASTLQINIKTYPNHRVFINIAEPSDKYQLIDSIRETADSNGLVSTTFTSDSFNEIKLYVQVNNAEEKIMFENFGTKSMFEPLYLQIIPGKVNEDYRTLEVKNETKNETVVAVENVTNQTVEETIQNESEKSRITGSAIFNNNKDWIFSKTTAWIAGIAVIVAILVVFLVRRSLSGPPVYSPKIQSRGFLPAMPKPRTITPMDEELSKTEEEIENVRSRIERIKKIKEAQRRLKEEQDALRKLENDKD